METRQASLENATIAPRVSSRTKSECKGAASVKRVSIRRILENPIVSFAQKGLMETRQDFLNVTIAPRVSIRRILENPIVTFAQKGLMETRQGLLNATIAPRVSSRTKPKCKTAASVNRGSIRSILDNQVVSFAHKVLMET